MKPKLAARPRGVRLMALGAGALGLGAGAAVALPSSGEAQSPAATMAVQKGDQRVGYRERVVLRGDIASGQAEKPVALQYAPDGDDWRTLREIRSLEGGRYAASVRPRRSGRVRVAADGGQSAAQPVAVAARVHAEVRRHVRRGGVVLVKGTVRPGHSGRRVYVQIHRDGDWDTVEGTRTRDGGRFKAAWRQRDTGSFRVRAVFRGDSRNARHADRASGHLNVYRSGHASWYGPGFYGNRTACGRTLGRGTLGVAHKSLPCGTDVTFRYRGRSVTVPVIDRGPYAAGRDWDLTGATKRKLRFGSTGTVWAAY
ncbi:MAG: septal ring lytic transglycosylase RlpA family protein [Thermoleophilaceae bacterium]